MATRLRSELEDASRAGRAPGLAFTQATESNGVFATLPKDAADRVREQHRFYDWDPARGEVRWMCSWDTTEEDIDGFVATIVETLAAV
jgi:threonine aldolase